MNRFKQLRQYPSAIIGMLILLFFIVFSIYTVFALPYDEAIRLWRGGPGVWEDHPRRAAPVWLDYFTADRLPPTIKASLENNGEKTVQPAAGGMKQVEVVLPFEFNYDRFPREISLFTEATFSEHAQIFSVYLRKPNYETITLDEELEISESHIYRISQDAGLRSKLGQLPTGDSS